eukprot:354754-Hanusia_phi.AAC.1
MPGARPRPIPGTELGSSATRLSESWPRFPGFTTVARPGAGARGRGTEPRPGRAATAATWSSQPRGKDLLLPIIVSVK